MSSRPLKVFPCYAHADRDSVPQGDDMRGLPEGARLTTLALAGVSGKTVWAQGYLFLIRSSETNRA
jgi:hypothetical protein